MCIVTAIIDDNDKVDDDDNGKQDFKSKYVCTQYIEEK